MPDTGNEDHPGRFFAALIASLAGACLVALTAVKHISDGALLTVASIAIAVAGLAALMLETNNLRQIRRYRRTVGTILAGGLLGLVSILLFVDPADPEALQASPWARYLSTDGARPASVSAEDHVGPLGLDATRERVNELLGAPDEQDTFDGVTYQRWDVVPDSGGIRLSIQRGKFLTSADQILQLSVTVAGAEERFALSRGDLLGATTFGDVSVVAGCSVVRGSIEGQMDYSMYYQGGPEGTLWFEYSFGTAPGDLNPLTKADLLRATPTSYSISRAEPSMPWASAPPRPCKDYS